MIKPPLWWLSLSKYNVSKLLLLILNTYELLFLHQWFYYNIHNDLFSRLESSYPLYQLLTTKPSWLSLKTTNIMLHLWMWDLPFWYRKFHRFKAFSLHYLHLKVLWSNHNVGLWFMSRSMTSHAIHWILSVFSVTVGALFFLSLQMYYYFSAL